MKLIFMMLSLIGLFITLVPSVAAAAISDALSDRSDHAHPLVPIQYVGNIGGYDVALNGSSVQDILTQISTIYPEFNSASFLAAGGLNKDMLESRNTLNRRVKDGIFCWPVPGQPWQNTWIEDVQTNMATLRSIGGRIGVSPRSCAYLACQDNSAVEFCNDNFPEFYPALTDVADMAQDIINQCLLEGFRVCGQEFDTVGINVIVRAAQC